MGRWPAALVVATVALSASEASAQETTGASHRVYGGLIFGFGQ
jgi:hypothetical protein